MSQRFFSWKWPPFPRLGCRAAEPQSKEVYRAVGGYITGASDLQPGAGGTASPLEFESSDNRLNDAFRWAKTQALAYVFDVGDPVGPWYEAVEPGREAFCIRDTSHQALGAMPWGWPAAI